jgi:hypothetical protein
MRKASLLSVLCLAGLAALVLATPAQAGNCGGIGICDEPGPTVSTGTGSLTASYFEDRNGVGYASNAAESAPAHRWRLLAQCDITDAAVGGCNPDQLSCPIVPDRLLSYYIVQSQRLTLPDHAPVDGRTPLPELPIGTPFGPWAQVYAGCVDVTDLNPAPTPDEIYRYLRTLPLPALPTRQQPPGTALVGLPVVFHTDGPTSQGFDLTIRGYAVHITATATSYTWHTGDGTDLTTTSPGAPWPDTTVTHTYRSGSYTSSLTTTWTATFTLDGSPPTPVPGSTTTDGPATTFAVVQAHPVLTNPYD